MARTTLRHRLALSTKADEPLLRCASCGGTVLTGPKFFLRFYGIFECATCGAVCNPSIDGRSAPEIFDDDYHGRVQSEAFVSDARGPRDPSAEIWTLAHSHEWDVPRHARALDIGAATGSFMELARTWGWQVHGIELSASAVRQAEEFHRVTSIRCGTAKDALEWFERESLDVVTLWDVIEHVYGVREVLESVNALLRPGGHLFLATDDFGSLVAGLARGSYRVTRGRLTYPMTRYFIPYNSIYPTTEWLAHELERGGFSVLAHRGIDYPVEKMNLSRLERPLVRGLYAVGRLVGKHTQVFIACRKVE